MNKAFLNISGFTKISLILLVVALTVSSLVLFSPPQAAACEDNDEPQEDTNCSARSQGYFKTHDGCHSKEGGSYGSSIWADEVQTLSNNYSDYFGSVTGTEACNILWQGGPDKREKAESQALALEMNIVSLRLDEEALVNGADDGSAEFDNLGLGYYSTIGKALTEIEEILANPSASDQNLEDAKDVAEKIILYFESNPGCVYGCSTNADCDDRLYCNGSEACIDSECVPGTPPDCSSLEDQCNNGACDEGLDSCVKEPVADLTPCDDGLWCNIDEVCLQGTCSNGSLRDCSYNNISEIATCDYDPDGIHETWDSRPEFISSCDEEKALCTEGDATIIHSSYNDPRCIECPPVETKKIISGQKIECDYFGEEDEADSCWFVSLDNEFSFETVDGAQTYYRIRWKEDFPDAWGAWSSWLPYTESFSLQESSIHEIEYYSVFPDCLEETHHFEIDIVDESAPEPKKTVGDPKTLCTEEQNCDWIITMSTPILLECNDIQPHPVGNTQVCYRYFLDGVIEQDWVCVDSPKTLVFDEECRHQLEFYCRDSLGNESATDTEIFKIRGKGFEIILNKKWNLVSVPFVLLNGSPEELFKDVKERIQSVWAYDAIAGKWHAFYPNNDAPSDLGTIEPGWGYWVNSYDNNVVLVIGGSLLDPIEVPPSKSLAAGWNLIGYYGLGWDSEQYSFCGSPKFYNGSQSLCALNSLVDTQEGFPRWGSLVGYSNCGLDNAHWEYISLCSNTYAGKGYWIEMDLADLYAPATNCISKVYCS